MGLSIALDVAAGCPGASLRGDPGTSDGRALRYSIAEYYTVIEAAAKNDDAARVPAASGLVNSGDSVPAR
jgi:hypothetical protein